MWIYDFMRRHEWKYELFISNKIQENKQRLRHKSFRFEEFHNYSRNNFIGLSNKKLQRHRSLISIRWEHPRHCLHIQIRDITIKATKLWEITKKRTKSKTIKSIDLRGRMGVHNKKINHISGYIKIYWPGQKVKT